MLALKNGVPAIAIDPEVGGAKIRRQAEKIGWPVVFNVDDLTDEKLQEAFDYCLTEDARAKARECCQRSVKILQEVRDQFISALNRPGESQRTKPVHGRRWLQDQWQGTEEHGFEEHSFAQLSKLESSLVKERQKVQRLRKRTQRLNKQIERLNEQPQNVRESGTRRLLRRLDHIRAEVLGKLWR